MSKTKTSITVDRAKLAAAQRITGATSASGAIDAALSRLIEEAFWASFDAVTPEDYRAATAADGDELSEDYGIEDAALDDDRVRA